MRELYKAQQNGGLLVRGPPLLMPVHSLLVSYTDIMSKIMYVLTVVTTFAMPMMIYSGLYGKHGTPRCLCLARIRAMTPFFAALVCAGMNFK
jgi:hypothetical protein